MHRCLDIDVLSRFLYRSSEIEEILRVEAHLRTCISCQERVARLQHHGERLFEEFQPGGAPSTAACPTPLEIDHFVRQDLAERQMVRLQEHLGSCGACRELWGSRRRALDLGPEGPAPYCTREPEVDVLAAREGVRIDRGAAAWVRPPSVFLQEMGLAAFAPDSARVQAQRRLRFRLARPGTELDLQLDLRSPEGFLLEIALRRGGRPVEDEVLMTWTRTRVVEVRQVVHGRTRSAGLLQPGHYFVGPSPDVPPLLAVCVRNGWLGWEDLLRCGYAHCTLGAFDRARDCFRAASALLVEPAAELERHVAAFVSRRSRRWRAVPPVPPAPEPGDLDLGTFSARDHAALADLVRWLDDRASDAGASSQPAPADRAALARLLARVRRALRDLGRTAVSTP